MKTNLEKSFFGITLFFVDFGFCNQFLGFCYPKVSVLGIKKFGYRDRAVFNKKSNTFALVNHQF
jgi:hypothetical protein